MDTLRVSVKNINKLPKKVGVYLFYSQPTSNTKNPAPIYIGKAINIRIRVKNHFLQPSFRDNLFIGKVTRIGFLETASEIEALILEANLIKKHQPKFNVVWRDDKNYFYVAIAENVRGVPYVFITHQIHKSEIINHKSTTIGPFVEGGALKKALKYLRRVFHFYTSSRHSKNPCTWCHLDLCPGPNPSIEEYRKNIQKLEEIFRGSSKKVLNSLKKEMAALSKENKFEEAAKKRDQIQALEQIMLHAHVIENMEQNNGWSKTQGLLQSILGTTRMISRIECFDISNIQGKNATGSMTVFKDGLPDKSQYKKFSIRIAQPSLSARGMRKRPYELLTEKPNDIAMLKQVLIRRFNHPEWPYPEVMLIDGGKAQLNVAIQIKNEGTILPTAVVNRVPVKSIKIISIAKGRQELFIEGIKAPIPLKSLPQEVYNVVKYLDDEAHRFAISYHKLLRKKKLMI